MVQKAASAVDIPRTSIVVLDDNEKTASKSRSLRTVDKLVAEGKGLPPVYSKKLSPMEGRVKMAFLCFSSGTTGKPKVGHMLWNNTASSWRYSGRRDKPLQRHQQRGAMCYLHPCQ